MPSRHSAIKPCCSPGGSQADAIAVSRGHARAPNKKTSRATAAANKAVSGMIPQGDVRLCANIREDLHLQLKIAAAVRRTTIGEQIEELIEALL